MSRSILKLYAPKIPKPKLPRTNVRAPRVPTISVVNTFKYRKRKF